MRYLTWYRPGQHDYGYAERAMKAGLAGFEVVHRQSYLTPEVQEQYLEDLRRIKVELGAMVAVHAPAGDVNLGSLNSRVRQASFEEIRESMEFASRIGLPLWLSIQLLGFWGCLRAGGPGRNKCPGMKGRNSPGRRNT